MAEDKKPYKLKNPLILLFYGIFISAILNGILAMLQKWFSGTGTGFLDKIWPTLSAVLQIISMLLSVFFATGIVYSNIRLSQLNKARNKELHDAANSSSLLKTGSEKKNSKWERVLKHIQTDNPNDWRTAILEADIILDDMMDAVGYSGATLSDKLKAVEKSDFTTIDLAWEAHKVRNQIAHEGSDFLITYREAKRVVGLYRKVFEEFRFI